MNSHDRRTQTNARHLGLESTLVLACEMRHVRRRTAHVEADHLVEARKLRHCGGTDNAARRAGQNRVLTLKFVSVSQSTRALHELQSHIPKRGLHLLNVATQDRRQIRIHHRSVATRNKLHERRHFMRHTDLRESDVLSNAFQRGFMLRIAIAVHQAHGDCPEALVECGLQVGACFRFVQWQYNISVRTDALVDFNH